MKSNIFKKQMHDELNQIDQLKAGKPYFLFTQ